MNNSFYFSEISPDRTIPAISSDLKMTRTTTGHQVVCRMNLRNEAMKIVHDKLHNDQAINILKSRLWPVPDFLEEERCVMLRMRLVPDGIGQVLFQL